MNSGYFVYVLFSYQYNRYYVGSSVDPQKRLISHNDPRNRGWTKRYAPWVIIYTEKCKDKRTALSKEKWLKSGVGREFIKKETLI
jgi:putative endonuclease